MSREQQMAALALAQHRRLDAAQLRRELTAGKLTPAQAVADPRSISCSVSRFLKAIPRFGPQRSGNAMRWLGVTDPMRKVGELSERQRALLADVEREIGKH